MQAFISGQGPAQPPPPAPAPAPALHQPFPLGLGSAEAKAYLEFLATRQVTPSQPRACSISVVCMLGTRTDQWTDYRENNAEATHRVVTAQDGKHDKHRPEQQSEDGWNEEEEERRGGSRQWTRTGQRRRQRSEAAAKPKYDKSSIDHRPGARDTLACQMYGGGPPDA